ncbi:MAG TPA: hypothetical protein VE398_22185, partial [Acidobacteriota bacterium]|nr:hypothetical protein [Acidobacteriota bacterium]
MSTVRVAPAIKVWTACALIIWTCGLHAEDLKKPVAETKEASPSDAVSVPPGMTERELFLLKEIELLKKRMSELEARLAANTSSGSPESLTPAAAGLGQAATLKPAAGTTAANAAHGSTALQTLGENSAMASAIPIQSSNDAGAKPARPHPDPFAFADFTWLNGNPRTKESPL